MDSSIPPTRVESPRERPLAPEPPDLSELGDFTTNYRVIPISLLAIVVGVVGAYLAVALLTLINIFTQLFFYHRWSTAPISPSQNTLGWSLLLVPVLGGLIIGVMARYGSERIRGHGIPEALESILTGGSRVEPRVALLKPVSSAISIGSGGPFGAEGPIIMTGGAVGSIVAQLFRFSSAERKTLLVAGASAGMAATFSAPVASVMLAVELLLFELKPRSLVPVVLACASASWVRHDLLGAGPLFPVPVHIAHPSFAGLMGCAIVGQLAGVF
jgi:H+/Cl- antiporter ClcA